jgi:CheY-like chemotaxis protein
MLILHFIIKWASVPGMDEYAEARLMKDNPALTKIPIIAVTCYAMSGVRDKAPLPIEGVILKNPSIRILS